MLSIVICLSDINTILKFALMEFKSGEAEKGVTMFESVLKNHPKRTDIWSVYIDMLIKDGEYEQVRYVSSFSVTDIFYLVAGLPC